MQSLQSGKGRVLCVGLVCLDIVQTVDRFPEEDTDQRCLDCVWQRGGNASNTASVLGLLGQPVEFFGTIALSQESGFLRDDFSKFGVETDHVVECPATSCPLSTVIVNKSNGSRTILHTNKNLPELSIEDFKTLDLSQLSWIHFECRPTLQEIGKMLKHLAEYNQREGVCRIMTSLELEKARPGTEHLWSLPDFLFLSKEFAAFNGYHNMEDAVIGFSEKIKEGTTVICAWGEKGAAAKSTNSELVTTPALKLDKVVDTLAAGDTFNAATIACLNNGPVSTLEAITYGCKVAGTKCQMIGLRGLADLKS